MELLLFSEVLCTRFIDWPVCSPLYEVLCTHLPAHSLSWHTPRQRYELGHFPCGSRNCYGVLCSGLSRNQSSGLQLKVLCHCLQYHGLKHGPKIWVITGGVGILDLI